MTGDVTGARELPGGTFVGASVVVDQLAAERRVALGRLSLVTADGLGDPGGR